MLYRPLVKKTLALVVKYFPTRQILLVKVGRATRFSGSRVMRQAFRKLTTNYFSGLCLDDFGRAVLSARQRVRKSTTQDYFSYDRSNET